MAIERMGEVKVFVVWLLVIATALHGKSAHRVV